jgi:hypothetical protein
MCALVASLSRRFCRRLARKPSSPLRGGAGPALADRAVVPQLAIGRLFPVCLLLLGAAAPASGSPLVGRHVRRLHLSINHKKQAALGVRPCADGWHLTLPRKDNALADRLDVTPRTPARTLSQGLDGDELYLDSSRFAGGHTYQLQLRRGETTVGRGYVFLYPKRSKPARDCPAPQRFEFGSGEGADGEGAAEVEVVAKNGL